MAAYEISSEPVLNVPYNKLPPDLDRVIEELYYLVQTDPAKAIIELERWIERYPGAAKVYNFLSMAYEGVGDTVSSDRIARENYRRHPDYLFAKLNYAELCLQSGNLDEFQNIFNNKYDLSQLYPERRRFHITEFASFMGIMGRYFCEKGDLEQARVYHHALEEIAPDRPETAVLRRGLRMLAAAQKIKGVLRAILPTRPK